MSHSTFIIGLDVTKISNTLEKNQAATIIQKNFRGYQARHGDYRSRNAGNGAAIVAMIEPLNFFPNPETAKTNAFQQTPEGGDAKKAIEAHQLLVSRLRERGIDVHVIKGKNGEENHNIPDETFLNNWFSIHTNPKTKQDVLVLYPVHNENRRAERKEDIIRGLKNIVGKDNVIDLTHYEGEGKALEGTGSLIFDHTHHKVYMCCSPRSNPKVLKDLLAQIEQKIGIQYDPVIFNARDNHGTDIYHTNVMMSVGTGIAMICLESIPESRLEEEKKQGLKTRQEVKDSLTEQGQKLIELTQEQVANFAGNVFELKSKGRQVVLAMSERAYTCLEELQKQQLQEIYGDRIVTVPNQAIEKAGGSVRCEIAAINTSRSREFIGLALQQSCAKHYQPNNDPNLGYSK